MNTTFYEKATGMERVEKLAGRRNVEAQFVLISMMLYVGCASETYLGMADQIGLYYHRISMLYHACHYSIKDFATMVNILYKLDLPQKVICGMTQEDFNNLVSIYAA